MQNIIETMDAINQIEKDYKVLYEALERISNMVALNQVSLKIKSIADNALDKVMIIP